ncbi:hypothetical protein C8F04DRAFT_1271605 [Mycena alexandri]|uniref:Uncharacterized protein n=1 Tax=Mycena alexandri TaxID=1745969 RepID=A0AAD6WSF4_9AGAR|nr:hypothetical protein C8F04DRAFT_1271605 [Mycena alexandri]
MHVPYSYFDARGTEPRDHFLAEPIFEIRSERAGIAQYARHLADGYLNGAVLQGQKKVLNHYVPYKRIAFALKQLCLGRTRGEALADLHALLEQLEKYEVTQGSAPKFQMPKLPDGKDFKPEEHRRDFDVVFNAAFAYIAEGQNPELLKRLDKAKDYMSNALGNVNGLLNVNDDVDMTTLVEQYKKEGWSSDDLVMYEDA